MATTQQAIRAGAAYVEVLLSDSAFVRGLEKASKKLKAFGEGVASLGTKMSAVGMAVAAPMIAFAKLFAHGAHEMETMSQRTGVTVESLSELKFAADMSGASVEELEKGLRFMQRNLGRAGQGAKQPIEALRQLGLSLEDLRGLSTVDQFKLIADRLSGLQSPALRAAIAMQLFGRGGMALMPLLRQGAAGIEAYQEECRRFGLTMSTVDVAAGAEFEQTLKVLWAVLKKVGTTIGSAITPLLQECSVWVIENAVKLTKWIKANKNFIVTIFKVAVGVMAAGFALMAIGKAIIFVGFLLHGLATIMGVVGSVFSAMGGILAAIVSPVGLIVAAVAGLGALLLYVSGLGGKALAWLGERFTELKEIAGKAFQGITDALMAGDFALAGQILWLTLKMAWIKGVGWLQGVWLTFRNSFLTVASGAFYGALAIWHEVQYGLGVALIETTAFLSSTWANFSASFQAIWAATQSWLVDRLHELHGVFDSTFDVEAAKKANETQTRQKMEQILAQRNAALGETEAKRTQERSINEQQTAAVMKRLADEKAAYEGKLGQEQADKEKATQDELDKARADWQASIDKAKQEREASDKSRPELKRPKELRDYFGGMQRAVSEKVQVLGTFSGLDAERMGAGGVQDRIAAAAEATAQNTKDILEGLNDGGELTFE